MHFIVSSTCTCYKVTQPHLGISYQQMPISIMHFISQHLYCILLTTCIVCLYNFSQLHLSCSTYTVVYTSAFNVTLYLIHQIGLTTTTCSTYTALCTLHSPSLIPSYVTINIPFINSKHTYPTVSLCISNLILYPNG